MRKNSERSRPLRRSSCGERLSAQRGGTVTPGGQDLQGARAEQCEEVRVLRLVCGNSSVPFCLHARTALPPDTLLTDCHASVSQ